MGFCPVSLETPGQLDLILLAASSSKRPSGSEHSPKSHLSHGYCTALDPVCDGATVLGESRPHSPTLTSHERRCGLEGSGAGPCRKLFISGFELEPQRWASGPWAAPGCLPLCPGTSMHPCGGRGSSSRPGNALVIEWRGVTTRNPPVVLLPSFLPSPGRGLGPAHLQNWRE